MKKLIKFLLMLFSSSIALLVAAVVIIPLIVDLNDYKPEIEAAVKEKTGRTLSIIGELDLSFFPWLGVSTGKISLSNAEGFAEPIFAEIAASDIKIKLIPLLSKEVEVSTLILKGLTLNAAKNKQGISNWADLSQPTEAIASPTADDDNTTDNTDTNDETPLAALAAFAIGGIQIEQANISWNDQQAQQKINIKDLNLHIGAIQFNQAIPIKLELLVENSSPQLSEQLSLSTDLTLTENLQKIQLAQLKINSITEGKMVPNGRLELALSSNIDIDLSLEKLVLNDLNIQSTPLNISSQLTIEHFKSAPTLVGKLNISRFNPKQLMQSLKLQAPKTSDVKALQALALQLDLQGTQDSLNLTNINIQLDETAITASTKITNFSQPAIQFKLAIDNIDIDRYSPPKTATASKKVIATPATAVAASTGLIPVETLRGLNINGDLAIKKLKVSGLNMQGFALNIRAKKGILQTKQSIKTLYKGSYNGKITVNAQGKTPSISLNEHLKQVQLEPLLNALQPDAPAKIKGAANIDAQLSLRGNSIPAFKRNLNGKVKFSVNQGAVVGINIQKIIDTGKLAIDGKKMRQGYKNEQTLFSALKGSADIKKGIVHNPDLLLDSSSLDVKGAGTINLNSEALAYKIQAKLKKNPNNKKVLIKGRPIAINVKGTISKPTYNLDIMAMITDHEKKKINKAIDKALSKALGKDTSKALNKALGKDTGKAVNELFKHFF